MHKKEGKPPLLFKFAHEIDLVRVYILYRQAFGGGFLRVKADGNPLHGADIIDRALLVKISLRDVLGLAVKRERNNRRRNFLNNRELFFGGSFRLSC